MKKAVSLLSCISGAVCGIFLTKKVMLHFVEKWRKMSDKHLELMLLFNQWFIAEQAGKQIKDYFEDRNYNKIIIYGMSYIGERLYDELQSTEIEVVAAIDQNAEFIFSDVSVLSPDQNIPEVDCMVITPVSFYAEIKEKMSKKVNCPIISFSDILVEL